MTGDGAQGAGGPMNPMYPQQISQYPQPQQPGTPGGWPPPNPAAPQWNYTPPPPQQRKPPRWPWIAGLAGVVVLALVAVLIAVGTNDDDGAPARTGSNGIAASGPASSGKPGKKQFTQVPVGCALVSAATVNGFAPGATCKNSDVDNDHPGIMSTRYPSWTVEDSGKRIELDVKLNVGSDIFTKDVMGPAFRRYYTVQTEHDVTGLCDNGFCDDAYFMVGTSTLGSASLVRGEIVAHSGNASLFVAVVGLTSPTEIESALKAATHDVFAALK